MTDSTNAISRRRLARGAAWTVPVVTLSQMAPSFAASPPCEHCADVELTLTENGSAVNSWWWSTDTFESRWSVDSQECPQTPRLTWRVDAMQIMGRRGNNPAPCPSFSGLSPLTQAGSVCDSTADVVNGANGDRLATFTIELTLPEQTSSGSNSFDFDWDSTAWIGSQWALWMWRISLKQAVMPSGRVCGPAEYTDMTNNHFATSATFRTRATDVSWGRWLSGNAASLSSSINYRPFGTGF